MSATSSQVGNCGVACGAGDSFVQPGYTGTFSFIDNGGGFAQGQNLLSGTFAVTGSPSTTGAQFSSHIGSSAGSFDASATAGNLLQTRADVALSEFREPSAGERLMESLFADPNFAVGAVTAGQAFPAAGPFDAAGSGTFSSNPGPTSSSPEPGPLVTIGFGLCGLALVRRRRKVIAGTR